MNIIGIMKISARRIFRGVELARNVMIAIIVEINIMILYFEKSFMNSFLNLVLFFAAIFIEYNKVQMVPIRKRESMKIRENGKMSEYDSYGRIIPKPIRSFASPPANAFA